MPTRGTIQCQIKIGRYKYHRKIYNLGKLSAISYQRLALRARLAKGHAARTRTAISYQRLALRARLAKGHAARTRTAISYQRLALQMVLLEVLLNISVLSLIEVVKSRGKPTPRSRWGVALFN
ncbi:MAG: hypothetical protein F6K56_26220 [Moorea sp. SIO3G5]|nr:hypothetical protein [Moorena sp. SIO3G5]